MVSRLSSTGAGLPERCRACWMLMLRQGKARQGRAGQSRAEQSRAEQQQGRAGQMAGQGRWRREDQPACVSRLIFKEAKVIDSQQAG
jgi:hypothetical protein